MSHADNRSKDAKERDQEIGVVDSFPASDPGSDTATQGPRAVPAGQGDRSGPQVANAVTLTRSFKDAEAAKLALESLVRSVPLDRDATTRLGAELTLRVPPEDASRIEAMLREA